METTEKTTTTKKASTTPAKKGNRTTELIVGAAAMKLEGAVKGIMAANDEVEKLVSKAQDCTLKVVDLEDKIGGLEQDLQNKVAQNKIELQQAFDSNKRAFVDGYLNENRCIMVTQDDHDSLLTRVQNAETKMEDNIKKEVAIATNSLKATYENEKKVLALEYEKKEANNLAELNQLRMQNKFLEEQVEMWKDALDSERQAGIERAKASSIGTLNVGANTGR